MPTNFSTGLDTRGSLLSNKQVKDAVQSLADAIVAVEALVGISGSSVHTSLDWLLTSASSTNPGHLHSPAGLSAVIDTTAGDIAAVPATQAAGAVGKAADAGHVHAASVNVSQTLSENGATPPAAGTFLQFGTISASYTTGGLAFSFTATFGTACDGVWFIGRNNVTQFFVTAKSTSGATVKCSNAAGTEITNGTNVIFDYFTVGR